MTRRTGVSPSDPLGGRRPGPVGLSPQRRLLHSLRGVMAGSGPVQARLDRIVQIVAAQMVTEVCSCYVARPGEVLELFATVGLKPEAVHRTRLAVGEGLVGQVAQRGVPIALANAPADPHFAYRPETGEDPYQSFLGTPIIRDGKVRGVLVVQNRTRRTYHEEEIESLQTIAMVIAELLAGQPFGAEFETAPAAAQGGLPNRLEGMVFATGMGRGLAVLHRPHVAMREIVGGDPQEERARLDDALLALYSSLDSLLDASDPASSHERREILETYRMIAEDRGWLRRIRDAIDTGLSAEAAVQRVQNDLAARLAPITDAYLKERLQDFRDLTNRLLLHLAGKTSAAAAGTLPDDVVLVARSIGPAELLDYDERKLRAVVLEEGSPSSHVAIVARTLDIPVIGRCPGAMDEIEPFDPVIVDGENGQVFVRPAEDVIDAFEQNRSARFRRRAQHQEQAHQPALTRDGVRVSININAGLLLDVPQLFSTQADGIGLYRTEIPFMVRSAYPDVHAQTDLYARIYQQAAGRPVVFRTLDIGGDKTLPYMPIDREQANPALGWRAIRIGLDRPRMLRIQLRALIRACNGRRLDVMFPMIATVEEWRRAMALLRLELDRARDEAVPPPRILRCGVMVEVPSLLFDLDRLAAETDFLAIGSNDLAQYVFAAARDHPDLSVRYDPLSPPFLRIVRQIVEVGERHGTDVSVCGEMAGRPLDSIGLVAIGVRNLSMTPLATGPVKAAIRSLDIGRTRAYLLQLLGSRDGSLRLALHAFARDHGMEI